MSEEATAIDSRIEDRNVPPGWSTNPSSWSQRLPIVVLAAVGTVVAGHLAFFQEGIIDRVWEPFFGNGSRKILLESGFSRFFARFPIGDAGLGALGYLADAATGLIGGTKRWKTMPWIVIIFGIFVVPFGMLSIMLTVFQPVLYDQFCTLCLTSAVISLAMIGPAVDEVLASLQFMRRARIDGRSAWRVFWGLEN